MSATSEPRSEAVTTDAVVADSAKGAARSGPSKTFNPLEMGAWGFLIPFLIAYVLFMIYPVAQAAFMSFFDWDFLDTTQREFIGFDNYRRMFWGTEMTWSIDRFLLLRLIGLGLLVPATLSWRKGNLKTGALVGLVIAAISIFGVALGFYPGEGGRWSDSQFWLSFSNTLLFVVMSTPVIVSVGLGL